MSANGNQHTEGPWEAVYERRRGWSVIGGHEELSNGSLVRREVVERFAGWRPDAENGTNARLIAAAPTMYEALHKIAFESIGDPDASHREVLNAVVEIACAAIQKATGGPDVG